MSALTSRATLIRLRQEVVDGVMTAAEAAKSVGIARGTLASRWRLMGIVEAMPIVPLQRSRRAVAELIELDPSLSDGQLIDELAAIGITLNRSSVRGHRVALGIPTRGERMIQIDANWRPALKVTDTQLINARRKIEARESTVRRQAAELGVAVETMYQEWKRLGVIRKRPSGLAADSAPKWCRRTPVRAEIVAHLREYPWMTASDIADSMTADGYPIKARIVARHIKTIDILGSK